MAGVRQEQAANAEPAPAVRTCRKWTKSLRAEQRQEAGNVAVAGGSDDEVLAVDRCGEASRRPGDWRIGQDLLLAAAKIRAHASRSADVASRMQIPGQTLAVKSLPGCQSCYADPAEPATGAGNAGPA